LPQESSWARSDNCLPNGGGVCRVHLDDLYGERTNCQLRRPERQPQRTFLGTKRNYLSTGRGVYGVYLCRERSPLLGSGGPSVLPSARESRPQLSRRTLGSYHRWERNSFLLPAAVGDFNFLIIGGREEEREERGKGRRGGRGGGKGRRQGAAVNI